VGIIFSPSSVSSGRMTYVARVFPGSYFDTVIKWQRTRDTANVLSLTNSVRLVARQRKRRVSVTRHSRDGRNVNVYARRGGLAVMRMDLLYGENNVTQTPQFNDTWHPEISL